MKNLKSLFSFLLASFWIAIPLIVLYACACAIATFIENDYGTSASKAIVYNTTWFNFLHAYLLVVLIGTFITSKALMRKRYASIFFHSSLILIILGAGITRFFGVEGLMHIRENNSQSSFKSTDTYLNVTLNDTTKLSLKTPLTFYSKHLKPIHTTLNHKPLILEPLEIYKQNAAKKDNATILVLKATYNGVSHEFKLIKTNRNEGIEESQMFKDDKLSLDFGATYVELPFQIKLKRFELQRYAGSMSPSSYASEVEVLKLDNTLIKPYRIFMNHVLDYEGYRFFQSSYDTDEKGTILSVNKDPGKIPTYLGYAMLILGALWLLFDKEGRFLKLSRFLKSQQIASFLLALVLISPLTSMLANDKAQIDMHGGKSVKIEQQNVENSTHKENSQKNILERLKRLREYSKEHLQAFQRLQVQDFDGRIKPLDTISIEYVHKILRKDSFQGLNAMQVLLGIMFYPDDWRSVKMIYTSTQALRKLIGTPLDERRIAFRDIFDHHGYKLQNHVEEVNQKSPNERNEFDKDILKVDERINLVYTLFSGQVLRIFPNKKTNAWLSPIQAINSTDKDVSSVAQNFLKNIFNGFDEALQTNEWHKVEKTLKDLSAYQEEHSKNLYLSPSKVDSEIFLNHTNFFNGLTLPYIFLGLLLFIVVINSIIKNTTPNAWLTKILYIAIILCAFAHSIGLILRWYVSEHSPWSNAYESMLYIAWASIIAGFILRSKLALSASSFLAGIALFVAHLGFMDPQIGNLVPVLKSYWLNIHVSIITASYGFLGLCFVLGILNLVLFILRKQGRSNLDKTILSVSAINEMSMILGLFMLTAGNFLGGVWANESWGRYWGWDPKETWALISICVYALILHLRFLGSKNWPFILASSSVLGFYSILMTYFGVNYYLSGLHSYAAGDPLPIPTFLYPFVATTFILVIWAYFKRHLSLPKLQ
ncbi:cytochrome c biogenesis protein [Helicobacter cetorum]|uniref:Bifunctional cytochrome c biogenesis protein n=1 Tax=Helicobacter cetorum (strain ATCC BAA-540 / CCUG 52418 / MIT 99-5656) TaxID=1163745 RepID=I0EU77_HELCM|nr:cytochrome c biogenesis protein CcsA [Helicobacter cetorum]AFI06496.1 bifunctional cytochrome c biogenesis protein [Helicobacter cetorum MIT 99-5656]